MARGLANGVGQLLVEKRAVTVEDAYDIETIAATCGLLHDIGNPPFGHFGEDAIRTWFESKQLGLPETAHNFWAFDTTPTKRLQSDLLNFEGNAQTLRLLSKLQVLSDRNGLNLTAATFSALCKYTAGSPEVLPKDKDGKQRGPQRLKKLGFFTSEQRVVDLVRDETGTGDLRNPISLLVEAADDMVYSVVDIEDAIKKGVVHWRCVKREILNSGIPLGKKLIKEAEKYMKESAFPFKPDTQQEGVAQYFRTFLMRDASKALQELFFAKYDQIMDGSYEGELLYDEGAGEAGKIYKLLKGLGPKLVYNAKEVLRLEMLGYRVIHSLLDTFWQATQSKKTKTFGEKAYALMSQNYRMIFELPDADEQKLPDQYRKMLLVTDYICGMTDSYALNLHRELTHG